MPRVLLVLPEPPAPFGGAAARWFHVLLRGLSGRPLAETDTETTVLACSGGAELDDEAHRQHGESARLRFFRPSVKRPLSKLKSLLQPYRYPYSAEMTEAVRVAMTEPFDVIRFETHFTGWLAPAPPPHAELNVHQLYRIDGSQDQPRTLRERVLQSQVLRAERTLLHRFHRVSALTDRLADEVRRLHPRGEVRVTPMTIDPQQYAFRQRPTGLPARPTLGLIGKFGWGPTLSAAQTLVDHIWPEVRSKVANARLLLVGRGAGETFGHLREDPAIEVHNNVATIEPYFHQLDALVYLPTVGSGMKVKVMEAIAYGTPVLTNIEGAEGLPPELANRITVADNDEAIQRAVQLLSSGPDAHALGSLREELFTRLSPARCTDAILTIPTPRALTGAM